jgi:PAS domain S-box-containing protein
MAENKEANITPLHPNMPGEEEELKEQLTFLRAIIEDSSDLIAALNRSFCLVTFNQAFKQAFYIRHGIEISAGYCLKNVAADHSEQFKREMHLWERALEGEKVNSTDGAESKTDPTNSGIYKPVKGTKGLPVGAVFIGKNAGRELPEQPDSFQDFIMLADAMPQVVWTADPQGNRDFINNWACKYTGAAKNDLLGEDWLNYVHPEDLALYKAKLQLFTDAEEGFELEYRLRNGSGFYRWHLGRGILVRNKTEEVIKFIGTATDIHDHKSLLSRYDLKAGEMNQTLEAIPQVVWTTDPAGQVLFFNRQWYQYTGSTPEDSLNENWLSFVHPDDAHKTLKAWNHSVKTGKNFNTEYRLRRADGQFHWFIGKAVPMQNKEGQVVRWFGTISDIQDQILQRDELDKKNRKLFQINRYLDEFVHAVAHDLRSPVAGLKLSMELLNQVDESKQGQILKGCNIYLDRLDNTLKGLVQLIEVQEESQQQYYEPIDIHQVIDEVVGDLQQKLMDAGAAVKFKKLEWRTISYPKPYLYNILRNIIRYVLRFRDTSSRLIFNVSTRQTEDNRMILEIKDNGPGINLEKESKNLFKPFSHINKGSDRQGMGLAIVKHMVEKNGGKIEVKSALGKGTSFSLFLKEYTEEL